MADFIHLFELIAFILVCVLLFRIKGLVQLVDEPLDEEVNESVQEGSSPEESQLSPVDIYLSQANQRADELNDGILDIHSQYFDNRVSQAPAEPLKVIDQAKSFIDLQIEKLQGEPSCDRDELASTISCFLIGAADFMGKQARYCDQRRLDLVQKVLQVDEHYSEKLSQASYDEAFLEENIHIARAGAKAAKVWLKAPANSAFNLTSYLKEWHLA